MKVRHWLLPSFLCITATIWNVGLLAQDPAEQPVGQEEGAPKYYPPPQRLLRGGEFRQATRSPLLSEYKRFYTSWQNPTTRILNPGTGYDGVCEVRVTRTDGTMYGTGQLLPTGRHVITAAHLLYDEFDVYVANGGGLVRFDMATGNKIVNFAGLNPFVHPDFDGHEGQTPDLLIITLSGKAPDDSDRRYIHRGGSIVGQQPWFAGYGYSGYGTTGGITDDAERRGGENIIEADAYDFG